MACLDIEDRIRNSIDGTVQLSYEEACTVQKILIDRGYVVCMAAGDIGDDYKLSWIYAGSPDNTNFADMSLVVFTTEDVLWDIKEELEHTEYLDN